MNRLVYNERTEAIQFSKQPTSWCSVLQHVAMANPLHSLCFLLYFHLKYKESLLLNKKTSSLHKKTQETVVFSYI